ncbi:MAG: PIN domain-containing protein [Candidatus Cryptobacteroides sp.]
MTKVFYDTNALLDAILDREGSKDMQVLMELGRLGEIRNYTSILTIANIAYVLRKIVPSTEIRRILKQYVKAFEVLPMDASCVDEAIHFPGKDFEDNLQIACAIANNCNFIISRNVTDFQQSPIPVYTIGNFVDNLVSE